MKHPDQLTLNYKCKIFANSFGMWGELGGWIYKDEKKRIPICQGWINFYKIYGNRIEKFMLNRYKNKKRIE